MTWQDIPGYFDWHAHTDAVVASAPPGSVLIELGVLFGKSLAYLATKAREADKGLRVVGIDTFTGSPELFAGAVLIEGKPLSEHPVGVIAAGAVYHLHECDLLHEATLIASDSAKAAGLFADGSVWSVLIDADHSEEAVALDIEAWRPKVAAGGWLAGDDYIPDFPGVVAAVDRLVPARTVSGRTWISRIPR